MLVSRWIQDRLNSAAKFRRRLNRDFAVKFGKFIRMGVSQSHLHTWSNWLRGSAFLFIGIIVALALSRVPGRAGTLVVAVILSLTLIRFLQSGARLKFSLKTLLLLTGLVGCGIVLMLLGGPWKEIHHFVGYEVNIAMSPDGKLVAASQGTSIEIRETQTGRAVQTIKMTPIEAAKKASGRWTYEMEFTKDRKSLMTVGWQTNPSLLDIVSGKERRGWAAASGPSALSASGSRFLSNTIVATSKGDSIERCNVFDVELDEPILTIETNSRWCRCISPTGSHVFVGKDQKTAELWSVDEQRLIGTIPIPFVHPGLFLAKFSWDGRLLSVPTSAGVDVWDVTQCRKVAEWTPQKFNHVTSLEWSPDGSRFVASYIELFGPSGSAAAAATIAGNSTRNAIDHCFLLDQNCRELAPISGTNATFSPSGNRIATIYAGFLILDGSTGEFLTGGRGRPMGMVLAKPPIRFSPDGDWMFVNGDPTVYRRTRSEFWYGYYEIPAFWGIVFFLTAMILQLFESIYVVRLFRSRAIPQSEIGVVDI